MAVRPERAASTGALREPAGSAVPWRAGRPPPGRGAEFWWWLFMRVSGVILLFLVVGHILVMHVFGGGVQRVNFQFVAVRWQNPFIRTWDWLILSLGMVHGINGLRLITLDYVRRPGVRVAVNGTFAVLGILLFALGSVVVFSFNPCQWPGIRC